jgi:Tfp pilus assembly protein PilN
MIEINLLPEELRQAEGTPPARLAAIMGSVVLACGLGVWASKYYMVDIPAEKNAIKACDSEIADLNKKLEEVKKIDAEIETLKGKVAALNNLSDGRMRYARLFEKLCSSMPDHVWFRSFAVTPDGGPSKFYRTAMGGKRYQIALSGYATAESGNPKDMENKMTELINTMRTQFGIPKDDERPKPNPDGTPAADFGFNKFLGARFDPPKLLRYSFTKLPSPPPMTEKAKKLLNPPTDGLDFQLNFCFEMPASN